MKKRMLTLFLVFAILLAMVPAAGAAESSETVTLYLEDGSIDITPSTYSGAYT